jgi:hypothetical protein
MEVLLFSPQSHLLAVVAEATITAVVPLGEQVFRVAQAVVAQVKKAEVLVTRHQ